MAGKGPTGWKSDNYKKMWELFQDNYGAAKNLEELVRLSRAHSPTPGDSDYSRRTKERKAAV